MAGIHAFAMESLPYFYEQAWDLWYKEQTTCVLLLNFRTFMETPFALNSLPLRQRARWRVRSQVSWRKTCKASALYTIGIHAFFINLRNPIPLQIHKSPPFATPDAKSCFCFPTQTAVGLLFRDKIKIKHRETQYIKSALFEGRGEIVSKGRRQPLVLLT